MLFRSDEYVPESHRKKIAQLAPTRWVQRHESLVAFKEFFLAILEALEYLDQNEIRSDASDLIDGISSITSVFALLLAERVAGQLKFLSTLLQSKNLDLISAYEDIDAARLVLSDFLGNKAEFESLYKETSKLCDQTEIKRLTLRYETARNWTSRTTPRR